jgi:energy-coupling factor transporter ATP-binding protein EcfA2
MNIPADQMELREDEIRKQYDIAIGLLEGFDHTPRIAKAKTAEARERSPGVRTSRRFRSTTPGLVTRSTARPEGVHLLDRIESCDGDDRLVSTTQANTMQSLRRAISIALAIGELFAEQSGLSELKRENFAGQMPKTKSVEFSELLAAEALIVTFTFANSTSFLLSNLATDVSVEIGNVEEVLTDNALLGLHGCLWELDQDLAIFATDEPRMVATILAYSEQVMEKIALRAQSTGRLEAFTNARYRVEADDLTISGFTPARKGKSVALTMTFKKPNEVVGNHIAKYQAMKLAKMVMAYDFDRKLNPFAEMGGFIFTFMGDGKPGTGKTTLIQMMAGLVNEYCRVADYPFRYQNFSIDQIDSYQGKSGQNAKAFINNVMDPNVIGFGTVDDIDQIAGKRGDRQSSAGQQEVTAVLMEAFSGANTVVRGNCTFGMFSNYPENVDDALRQRAGARFLVDGPQTQEDYIDILHLLMGKNHSIPLGEHELFAAQEIKKAVAQSFEGHRRPHEDRLLKVWDATAKDVGDLNSIAKLGQYLKALQEVDDRFTGRSIKNITDAIKVRAMDFELPDEWIEDPDLFLFRGYDEKLAMIKDMTKPITVDIVIQEINRYADSEFRYADKSDEAEIESAVRDMHRLDEARKRYTNAKARE